MKDVEVRLAEWKAVYDLLREAQRQLKAGAGREQAERESKLRRDIARLMAESNSALAAVNRALDSLKTRRMLL